MASKRREATLRRRYDARVQMRLTPTTAGVGTDEQHLFDDDEGELTSALFKTIRYPLDTASATRTPTIFFSVI